MEAEYDGLRIICPLCGQEALVRWRERDRLCGHLREAREGDVCEASGLTLDDAAAIKAMRVAGGERLRLAAHP